MTKKIITYSFYILFFLTPLFWTPFNFELFEYNKMMLVYLLTVIIAGAWVFEMIEQRTLILKRSPIDIPILLFLGANILSTIFSIDRHTSIWGYYSRSNGGLLSIISYTVLFYALISHFDFKEVKKFLILSLTSGLIVAFYGVLERMGIDKNFWVQDVQARVFSTLGQPNWLAAFLLMLIFPGFYFYMEAKSIRPRVLYYLLLVTCYLAFTFTYSRGASLGLVGGLITVVGLVLVKTFLLRDKKETKKLLFYHTKLFALPLLGFLIINILFGSAYTRLKLFAESAPKQAANSATTQLENGGTESGQIRLIVWKGAVEIFKHYPLFGSGVETFAYSYYQFRPASHNLVSEWDFLYNKAHNEFLNYLANTGAVGFLTYLSLILGFMVWAARFVLFKSKDTSERLFVILILASVVGYLIQNFFGFSVVILALYFYLFPAFALIRADAIEPIGKNKYLLSIEHFLQKTIWKRDIYTQLSKLAAGLVVALLVFKIGLYWFADTEFAKGEHQTELGNGGKAYNRLSNAVRLNPGEPFYHSELGYAAAAAAAALAEQDATLSAKLKQEAITQNETAQRMSPRNVSFWRTAVRTFFQLSIIDPTFDQKTVDAIDQAIKLAPTDAKLYYNKALILSQIGRTEEGVEVMKQALALKPNYRDAYFTLGTFYEELKQNDQAIAAFKNALNLQPDDPDSKKELEKLQNNSK